MRDADVVEFRFNVHRSVPGGGESASDIPVT